MAGEDARGRTPHDEDGKDDRPQTVPRKRGPKPGTPAARKGGLAASARLGHDFYVGIGRKGGETVKRTHSLDYYSEMGKKGGATTRERMGSEFYAEIGRKGGQRNKKKEREPESPERATQGGGVRHDERRRETPRRSKH